MTTIVTRSGKAAPLTNTELDANFTNLNTDKLEKGSNLSDLQSVSQARTNLGLGDLATQNKASLAGPVVLTDSSTSPALKITQTGTGNALVVEDAASDSTPFVIDADGRVVSGHATTSLIQASSYQAQFMGSGVNYPLAAGYTGASATGPRFTLVKNRSASWSSQTVVLSGDTLGEIDFVGSDGANTIPGARITATVDGTPGPNDMPGRLVFSTTPDNSSTPAERMRIDSAGNVGIGATSSGARLHVTGSATVDGQANVAAKIGAGVTSDLLLGSINGNTPFIAAQGANSLQFRTDATERMRIGSDGGVSIGTTAAAGANTLRVVNTLIANDRLEINGLGTGNRYAYIDWVGDDTYTDFGFRIIRNSNGPNASVNMTNRGTGGILVENVEAAPIVFSTSAAVRMQIDSAGNVGIGTAPAADSPLHIFSNAGGIKRVIIHNAATTANTAARYDLATGTPSAYSILAQTEDGAGNVSLQLATGVGVNQGIRLAPSVGNVTVNTVAGLGYGTGAGGTVTQATSKSTDVTLNKPTGQITTHNAALAAGASVSFNVNTNKLTAGDGVFVTPVYGTPGWDNYTLRVLHYGVGTFRLVITNISGLSQSDALTFTFHIIKGATA